MDILTQYRQDDVPFVRISAPMVRYTKLPFRLLVRKYGVDVVYSPMIMANSFVRSQKARDVEFSTCANDRPLIVQLASKDPCELAEATQILSPYCDGIDLNCGCPQKWAIESGVGSGLLKHPELISELVRAARNSVPRWREVADSVEVEGIEADQVYDNINAVRRQNGAFSVSTKLRIPPVTNRAIGDDSCMNQTAVTVELVRRLASMGVDWVTLHARTISQRYKEPSKWGVVKELVDCHIKHSMEGTDLPIVLNGDVSNLNDAYSAHSQTGCHGIMVARAMLNYPNLFASCDHRIHDPIDLEHMIDQWLNLSDKYSAGTCFKYVHQQTYWFMEPYLNKAQRHLLHCVKTIPEMKAWLNDYWHGKVETDIINIDSLHI